MRPRILAADRAHGERGPGRPGTAPAGLAPEAVRILILAMATTCPALHFSHPTPECLAADQAWWRFYEATFRPGVREEPLDVVELLRTPHGVAVCATDDAGTVGAAVLQILRDWPAILLLHVGLVPELRGQRLGGLLLEEAIARAAERARRLGIEPRGVVAEYDPPSFAADAGQAHRRERRLHFFEAHGARPLPLVFPRPTPEEVIERGLLYRPLAGGWPTDEEARAIARAIRLERYGEREEVPLSGAW